MKQHTLSPLAFGTAAALVVVAAVALVWWRASGTRPGPATGAPAGVETRREARAGASAAAPVPAPTRPGAAAERLEPQPPPAPAAAQSAFPGLRRVDGLPADAPPKAVESADSYYRKQFAALQPSAETWRNALIQTDAELLERLALPAAARERLLDLLVERQLAVGDHEDKAKRAERLAQCDARVAELLGAQYGLYVEHQRTEPERLLVILFNAALDEPDRLDEKRQRQLVKALADAPAGEAPAARDTGRLARAAALLSPAQRDRLAAMLERQRDVLAGPPETPERRRAVGMVEHLYGRLFASLELPAPQRDAVTEILIAEQLAAAAPAAPPAAEAPAERQAKIAAVLGERYAVFEQYERTQPDRFLVRRLDAALDGDQHLDEALQERLTQALAAERAASGPAADAAQRDARLLVRARTLLEAPQLERLASILERLRLADAQTTQLAAPPPQHAMPDPAPPGQP